MWAPRRANQLWRYIAATSLVGGSLLALHPGYVSAAILGWPHVVTAAATTPDGLGFWDLWADGTVTTSGTARSFGDMAGHVLNAPTVGIAPTASGHGYWLAASDGGVFSFGDAAYYGSMGGRRLNRPVVAIAATATSHGYWLAASDGGVFSFGDATYQGSAGCPGRAAPPVSLSGTARGYSITLADGTRYTYGDAPVIETPGIAACPVPPPPAGAAIPGGWGLVPAKTDVSFNLAYGFDPAQRLDVYRAPGAGSHPAIVWFHGGGWRTGSKLEIPDAVLAQIPRGYTVVSVEYRTAPPNPFPVAIQDAKQALRWVKANAGALNIRPDRLIAWGGSAGGYLAAMAGVSPGTFEPTNLDSVLSAQDSSVAAVIDFAGPTDMTNFWMASAWPDIETTFLGCDPSIPEPAGCSAELEGLATVSRYVGRSSPPAYLVYGELDPIVNVASQGDALARQWSRARGTNAVFYERITGAAHIPDGSGANRSTLNWFLDAIASGQLG